MTLFVFRPVLRRWMQVTRCSLLLAGVVAVWLACGPPPFVVNVTFPGEIAIERGAAVVYEGVKVGEVEGVALRQDDPQRAALVEVRLGISDRSVQIRAADRFHISSLRGVPIIEVEPASRPSPPLPDGATVAGVPPLITRLEGEIEEAIEGIGRAALEAVEEAMESIGAEASGSRTTPRSAPGAPRDDAARPDPTPPR